jgi:hypothetical protein
VFERTFVTSAACAQKKRSPCHGKRSYWRPRNKGEGRQVQPYLELGKQEFRTRQHLQQAEFEALFTSSDTWRSVANSVLETNRIEEAEKVCLLFGKMGGIPEV